MGLVWVQSPGGTLGKARAGGDMTLPLIAHCIQSNQLFENSIQMSDRGKQGKGQAEKEERGWGDME